MKEHGSDPWPETRLGIKEKSEDNDIVLATKWKRENRVAKNRSRVAR